MKYLSTFSGIGGFEYGISQALDHAECIGYSEIDKAAITTYEQHYEHKNYGDITAIKPTGLPAFDLLVGGFPCQAFSIAGKRHGFNETRGTLFFDIARILSDKRPRHLVLENVKGLVTHDGGKTLQTILGVLADLGYRVEYQVLNSKDFGVPQNRERIYIIGHLRERCERQVFPIYGNDGQAADAGEFAPLGAQSYIATRHLSRNGGLLSPISGTVQSSEVPHVTVAGNIWGGQSGRIYDTEGISPTLSTSITGGLQQPKILSDTQIRRLTPVETERLQGFPDNWTVGSDAQRYKQTGNAVTTNVVRAVMIALKECLVQANTEVSA